MEVKNRQNLDSPADDDLDSFLFESFTAEILVDLLKHKIMAGQANVSDVIQELVGDKEATVVIMKRK